jgi:hypothetical protein
MSGRTQEPRQIGIRMLTWNKMKWRYKAFAFSFVANAVVAASIPVFAFFTAWLLIPGASVAFWVCNWIAPECKGRYEDAAWVVGWFLNVIFCWVPIWILGSYMRRNHGQGRA